MENIKITPDKDLYAATEAYPPEDWQSETTSIKSSLYQGFIENGRRYQTLKNESFVPSDEQQFDAYESGHVTAFLMESNHANPFFRSPVGAGISHVLDIGTGKGSWAIDVADMFPHATVRGVDLFPPPVTWMPPNCILEVDDILEEWTWQQPFDLIHMRILDGAFTREESERLYKQCYEGLRPGGWIELLELCPDLQSEDDNWPENCQLKEWYPIMSAAAEKTGRPFDLFHRCTDLVREVGFVDIHEEIRKWPIGPWPRDN